MAEKKSKSMITIKLDATDIVDAINRLAAAIESSAEAFEVLPEPKLSEQITVTPYESQPVTQPPETPAAPTATQPPAQTPVNNPPLFKPGAPVCGDCNTYQPDNVLQSVGQCTNPQAETVNGWVPGDQAQTCQQYNPGASVAAPPVAAPPVAAPMYTLDDLSKACAHQLVDTGRVAELRAVLSEFGIAALPQLPSERYAEFANKLRSLGVQL